MHHTQPSPLRIHSTTVAEAATASDVVAIIAPTDSHHVHDAVVARPFYSFDSKQAAVRNKHQLPAAHWIPSATFPLVRPTHRHRLPVPPCPGRSVPLGSLNTQSFLNDSYLTRFLTCTVVYTFVHTHKKLMLFCILTPSAYFIQHKIHNNNISKLLCYSKQLKKRLKTLWFVYGCGAY